MEIADKTPFASLTNGMRPDLADFFVIALLTDMWCFRIPEKTPFAIPSKGRKGVRIMLN